MDSIGTIVSFLQRRAEEDEDAGDKEDTPYGYFPTKWTCILFIALFALTSVAHLGQAIRYRMWILIPTIVFCGLGESIGWIGRLWTGYNGRSDPAFFMGIVTTIIAPSFLTGAIFTLLGRIIRLVGPQYSWLSSKWLLIIFLTADILALVVQSAGGAMAATANTRSGSDNGGRIMMIGIIVQLVGVVIFAIIAADFTWRVHADRPIKRRSNASSSYETSTPTLTRQNTYLMMEGGIKMLLIGMAISTFLIVVRSVYRTIELADGWNGKIIQTQWYFNVFDGVPVFLAMFVLNVFHPGRLMPAQTGASLSTVELKATSV